jgi:hypothetical protein
MRFHGIQTNFTPFFIFASAVVVIGMLAAIFIAVPIIIIVLPLGLLAFFALTFSRLSVDVDDETVTVAYRFGMFRKRIRRENIESVAQTESDRWDGFGLRISEDLTSYMTRPGPAVLLRQKIGPTVRVGTYEPAALIAALRLEVDEAPRVPHI